MTSVTITNGDVSSATEVFSNNQRQKFLPIFNKRFYHLETVLTIHRPKKVLSAGSLCELLVPSPQSKCPKMTFIVPQSIMLQIQICCHSHSNVSLKTKTNTVFRGQAWVRPPANAGSRALFYPISTMPQNSTEDSGIFYLIKKAKTNIAGYHLVSRHVISATSDVQKELHITQKLSCFSCKYVIIST